MAIELNQGVYQIFQHGFVQCDGHAGNVLIRRHPNGKRGQHQVVLVSQS